MIESTTSVAYTPAASSADIPLTKYAQNPPQSQAGGVRAPQPRRPTQPGQPFEFQPQTEARMSQYGNSSHALPPGAGYPYPAPTSQLPHRVVSPPKDPFSDAARVPNYSKPYTQPPSQPSQQQPPPQMRRF